MLGDTQARVPGQSKIDLGPALAAREPADAILGRTPGSTCWIADELDSLRAAVRGAGSTRRTRPTWAKLVDDLFSDHVEPELVQPHFATDYPVELSPLAKRSPDDPRLVERFEPFVAGHGDRKRLQ